MRLCRDLTTNFHERFCNFTSSNNISLKCKKILELNRIRTVSLLDYLPSCYRVSLLPICLCSDVLTNKSRRQNNTESKDSLKCWPPVSGVCGHRQEASNGAEKWGNWKLFSLQRIWVEFRNNIALDNLRVSSNERYLQRAWIPVWNAQSDVRWWGWCAGPDVSRFTTLTRSGPGCGDNMQAYIIQEAEQINQCIMSLTSEKLKKCWNQYACSCYHVKSQRQSVRSWSVKCNNSRLQNAKCRCPSDWNSSKPLIFTH